MKTLLLSITCFCFSLPCVANENNLGQKTYAITCIGCHSPRYAKALGAPAAFDQKAWKIRIDNARKVVEENPRYRNAFNYLLVQVKTGKNLMPHHGLCLESANPNKSCTDEAYISAIKYMADVK